MHLLMPYISPECELVTAITGCLSDTVMKHPVRLENLEHVFCALTVEELTIHISIKYITNGISQASRIRLLSFFFR